jgi:hypothetical protein
MATPGRLHLSGQSRGVGGGGTLPSSLLMHSVGVCLWFEFGRSVSRGEV